MALVAAVLAPAPASAQSRSIGTVVIANGWSSADSAVASALAALESTGNSDAVVLYASKNDLTRRTREFIQSLRPSKAILIGGIAALTASVEADVVGLLGRAAVSRFEGDDRFDTAAKAVPAYASTLIVANGYSAADTGVAAALAATRQYAAVVLAERDSLTGFTERIIQERQPLAVEFVGGTKVLAEALEARVRELVPSISNVPRHAGAGRTATAADAAPNGTRTVVIANGWRAADMGVAAAYAAITRSAAVLYSEKSSLTSFTETRIRQLAPSRIVLVGGSMALDTSLHARLHALSPNAALQRLPGDDRIDTAVLAASGALIDVATDPPGVPTAVSATAKAASVTVTWTAPTVAEGTTRVVDTSLTGYDVQRRACTATDKTCAASPTWGTWVAHGHSGTSTTTTITGLTNGTTYQVRVAARNTAGLSTWSPSASATPLAQTGKPSVPGNVTLESANRSLQVSWNASIPPKNGTLDGYQVEWRGCTATDATCARSPQWGNWQAHSHSGTGTSTTISGLTNGTKYQVRVQATSSRGVSGWSSSQSAAPALLPSFALAPNLTKGNRQIVARWNEPAYSGSAISDYDVRYRACTATNSDKTVLTCATNPTWASWRTRSHSGTAKTTTITSLTNGTAYEVQVRARNANGVGPWSPSGKETPVSVPAAPTVTVEAGNTSLVVTWTVPSHNGSLITSYDVQHCESNCTNKDATWTDDDPSTVTTRHPITSLTNNTKYTVRVRAVNAIGNGPWSSTKSGTPKAVPEAPSTLTLTESSGQISVEWTAATDNGSAISDYDVRYRACTATDKTCTTNPKWGGWNTHSHTGTSTTAAPIKNLTNGTKYEVQVRARNANGLGPWSEASSEVPLGVPAQPSTPRVTADDGKLILAWTAPSDNGLAISGYTIERCPSSAGCNADSSHWTAASPTYSGTTPSHTITGLTNGTTYKVRIRAKNGRGDGPWSSSGSGTPTVRPDAPTSLVMTKGNRLVGLTWNAPTGKNVTVTGYDVQYQACNVTTTDASATKCEADSNLIWSEWKSHSHSGTGITATITGLVNGTKYQARVRARNSNGAGPWSTLASETPLAEPSKPTGLTLEVADQQLNVSWTASNANGSVISGYQMQHRACTALPKSCTPNPTWGDWQDHNDVSTGITRTISPLTNGTKYQVRVQAKSSDGDSGWTVIKSATPAAVPDEPIPTLVADDGQITVSWTEPDTRGSAITDYDVRFRECTATPADCTDSTTETWASWELHAHSGASRTSIIMGLTNGTAYQVQVRATNVNGLGPWSTTLVQATPMGLPSMPEPPRVSEGDGQLKVDWITPRSNGSTINGYDVYYQACIATGADESVHTCATNPTWGAWQDSSHSGKTTSHTIAPLDNGTAYRVRVRATTEASRQSPWSLPVKEMPKGAPGAPATVEIASGNGKLIVSWSTPSANGSSITGFKVQYCTPSDCSLDSDGKTKTVSGASIRKSEIISLTNGTTYYVRVRTTSSKHGDSPWTTSKNEEPGGPNAPSTPSLTAGPASGEITVTWSLPNKNHSDISKYQVGYCNDTDANDTYSCAAGKWNTKDKSTDLANRSLTLTSLTSGKSYKVRVRAENTQGWGAWSSTRTATPKA